jgi:hypothetical protein
MTMYRSFRCGKKEWSRLYCDILLFLFKNFRRELIFRHNWEAVQRLIPNYAVSLRFSNIVKEYLRLGRLNFEPEFVKYFAKANLSSTHTE